MRLAETIRGLWRVSTLDRVPFEELPEWYRSDPREAYHEFARRLQPIVFQAAFAWATRTGAGASQAAIDDLTDDVFADFAPEFANGRPEMLLLRFAGAIRRVLDDQAFTGIARRYYMQLPIYHLRNEQELSFIAVAYQDGVGPDTVARLARRFNVSDDRAVSVVRAANRSLADVMRRDFGPDELHQLTDGILS